MICELLLRCFKKNCAQNVSRLATANLVKFCLFNADCAGYRASFHTFASYGGSRCISRTICQLMSSDRERVYADVGPELKYLTRFQTLKLSFMKVPHRGMAGHSKWQNIKHIKQAKDATRASTFSKLARQMKVAVILGKSADPKFNNQLAHLVELARQANMPNSKIESVIKGSENSKDGMTSFSLDAKGPGNCFLIIEILTDNVNRTRNNLKHQLSKLGITFVDGSVKHAFKYKGIVNVDPSASDLSLEDAVDSAIEVGAEDVVAATEDSGENVLQFQCEPREFYNVKTALTSKGYALRSSGLCYIPQLKVPLNDEQLNVMSRICEVLEEHPDVVKFYDNVE